jgi:hypothetical protein
VGAGGVPIFSLRDSTGTGIQTVSHPSFFVADGDWHFLMGTRDVSAQLMTLYVDGSYTWSVLNSNADGPIKDDDGEADPEIIGAEIDAGLSSLRAFFQGQIDEPMYANRAFTPGEISSMVASMWDARSDTMCHCIDADGDGFGSQGGVSCPRGTRQDCNDSSANVHIPPVEVQNLQFSNKTTLTWTDQSPIVGPTVTYDLLRGAVGSQVGSGLGLESCVGSPWPNQPTPTATDSAIPTPGTGYRYLLRGRNGCGTGTYGNQGVKGLPGAQRSSSTCP